MAYEIIWTAEAESDFFNTITYLKNNWSITSAEKFIDNFYSRVEKLLQMPSLARATTKENFQMYKIDKKNVLFFKLESNHLILLSIYPYRKDILKSKYF